MDKILDTLLSRLSEKGIIPLHVPYLVRDMLNIVRDRSGIPLEDINLRLENLGWEKDILDDFIFELILNVTDHSLIDIGNPGAGNSRRNWSKALLQQ